MSDLKPRGIPLMLDGVERRLLFTLNVIDDIQSETGRNMKEIMEDLADEKKMGNTLKYLVTTLVNDETEREKRKNPECTLEKITERDAGELIGMDNIVEITAKVMMAYGYSLPKPEDDDPNQEGGQQNN